MNNNEYSLHKKRMMVCLCLFILYTQYFQYTQMQISYAVTILGGILIFICLPELLFYSNIYLSLVEVKFFLAFFIITFMTGIVGSIDSQGTWIHIISWFKCFTYFLISISILCIIQNLQDIITFCKFYILFSLFCVVLLYINPVNNGDGRFSVAYALNVNELGMYFMFACWCVLLLTAINSKGYYVALIIISILVYGSLMTGSRKNLLAIIFVIVLWLVWVFLPSNKLGHFKFLLFISILVCTVYLMYRYFYLSSNMASRMTSLINQTDDGNLARESMYGKAFAMFKKQFLCGYGFQGYSYYYTGRAGSYSHATYAELPACTGIVGCILFLGMYIYSFAKIIHLIIIVRNDETLKKLLNILKVALILWGVIIFMSTCIIFFYELLCFVIFGILFSVIRYAENVIYGNIEVQYEYC